MWGAPQVPQSKHLLYIPEEWSAAIDDRNPVADHTLRKVPAILSRDTRISLVYLIYDYFIRRRNKNIIFYLSIGLIIGQEANIIAAEERDELHRFVNKELKKIETQ